MLFFYRLFTLLLFVPIHFTALFSRKIRQFLVKRRQSRQALDAITVPGDRPIYWLHGASVGELDQCNALIRYIRSQDKNIFFIQSVFSDSVLISHIQSAEAEQVFFLPLDFPFAYRNIFKKWQPERLILAAWDTWPNLLWTAKRYHCPVYLFCATMSEKSGRNRGLQKKLTSSTLRLLDGISPTHEIYRDTFHHLTNAAVAIEVCGDSRFDSVAEKIELQTANQEIGEFMADQPDHSAIIFASSYDACDEILFPLIPDLQKQGLPVWIFPHKVDPLRIEQIQQRLQSLAISSYQFFSSYQPQGAQTIIFNKIGILAFAYQKGYLAYVGGGIHNRIHNIIEPAYFGLPILTGPKIQNASEAVVLKELGGLFTIQQTEQAQDLLKKLRSDDSFYQTIRQKNKQFVQSNRGASARFFKRFLS